MAQKAKFARFQRFDLARNPNGSLKKTKEGNFIKGQKVGRPVTMLPEHFDVHEEQAENLGYVYEELKTGGKE